MVTTNVFAGANGNGKITQIGGQVEAPSSIYFGIDPVPSGRASCNTGNDYQFVIDPSTPEGKAMYSALLTASSTGKNIIVQGTGNCDLGQPMETVSYWVFIQ